MFDRRYDFDRGSRWFVTVPLKPFFDRLESLLKVSQHQLYWPGRCPATVIGNANRQPTADELEKMRALVRGR